jgi:hypothetical protein
LAGLGDLSESQYLSNLENNIKRLGPIPPLILEGVTDTDLEILQKYLDCELNDKISKESKLLRH